MSIRDQTPIPFPPAVEVDRFIAIYTPPPSPLTSYSSPLPQIPSYLYQAIVIRLRTESPSTSHPLPLPSPIVLPHTRASVDMMRAATRSTYILASRSETPPSGTPPLLPIPLPTPLLPLLLPSTDYRAGVSKVRLLPRKRLCIALGSGFEVGKSSSAPTARPTRGLEQTIDLLALWMMRLGETLRERQDTNEIYGRLNDAQDDRLMESKAILSYEAWEHSMDASDTARSEVRALQTTILAQQTKIKELRAADRRRKTQLTEALTLLRTLQTQMAVLQSQQTPSRKPARPEIPEVAGSSS
ncbi:hypothetical protein Tco_0217045 [Tanacetum coccineum]